MERWKRYSYDEIAYGVWEKSSEEFCLSSDVEKLEANIGLLNTFITIRDERISVLEARVKEMEIQVREHLEWETHLMAKSGVDNDIIKNLRIDLGECQMRVSDLNGLSIAEKSLREETRAQRGYIAQLEARVKELEAQSEIASMLQGEILALKADLVTVCGEIDSVSRFLVWQPAERIDAIVRRILNEKEGK
jgi:predicted RNase H-like nuclease (RuvC/YqgF family)